MYYFEIVRKVHGSKRIDGVGDKSSDFNRITGHKGFNDRSELVVSVYILVIIANDVDIYQIYSSIPCA